MMPEIGAPSIAALSTAETPAALRRHERSAQRTRAASPMR
ncbi:Uncharacterised protein [Mycobacteroides abscessus subsp. abscessus]|nr:Uncharacterised protein [Mycobacteroides abscessus subsp. abscessus]